ncbi:hypothetical protein FSOLCH5_005540 [Fusarium solani]
MLSDVFTASAPHTDTIRIFRNAMGMWCRGENKQWIPEQIFPEKEEKRDKVIAPMSVSEEFLVPGEQTDVRSLTSNGHFIHHHPPPGIGLGWGDWDLYTEWQAHGRSVDKTWVPRGDWKPKVEGEFAFVADSDDPSAEIIVDRVIVRPDNRNAQRNIEGALGHQRASSWDGAPETLYQKFNPGSRPDNQRGGTQGWARGGRGQGGRGRGGPDQANRGRGQGRGGRGRGRGGFQQFAPW